MEIVKINNIKKNIFDNGKHINFVFKKHYVEMWYDDSLRYCYKGIDCNISGTGYDNYLNALDDAKDDIENL